MNEMQWTFIDRSEWPSGEWDSEPDKLQWQDEATGFACLVHRSNFGAWCGYVGVPPSHPLHGRFYEDINKNIANLDVHGGLTFSAACDPQHDEATGRGICHVPAPGEPDSVWWIGFDCAHAFDYSPGLAKYSIIDRSDMPEKFRDVYRNLAYVREETQLLAQTLAAMQ